jgi:transcription antitermination factor NusG
LRWYVVQTVPTLEPVAVGQITGEGFECFFPHRVEAAARKGQMLVVARFPSYLFVLLDLMNDGWERIVSLKAVNRLLPVHTLLPSPCPRGFVEDLRELYRNGPPADDAVDAITRSYTHGELVQVVSGAHAGYVGKFNRGVHGQVEIMVPLLGREFPLRVSPQQTSKAYLPNGIGSRITRTTTGRSPQFGRGRAEGTCPKAALSPAM